MPEPSVDQRKLEEADRKLSLPEFTDVTDGAIYRSKRKVMNERLLQRKRLIEEKLEEPPQSLLDEIERTARHRYILAEQFNGGNYGFSLRFPARVDADGETHPAGVTGGGPLDRICKDLLTGELFVARKVGFEDAWDRIPRNRVPKELRGALPREVEIEPEVDESPAAAAR